ncbi:transposable element Tcb2 transposase [Trichonephila clavipes]|nr:transposable element Tcb2 transposase [Trichonephila clavipes]
MPGKRARRYSSQLNEFERGLIIGIKTAGWSKRRVAGQVDRSECAVRNCWEQWTREGTHAGKTGSGATRKTTRKEDRRIVRQALVDPTVTRSTIRADVGVAIVPQTISRHLAEANLKSKHPFRALSLTPEHRQLRVQWCQARSMWNVTDWQKVVFSDESRFLVRLAARHLDESNLLESSKNAFKVAGSIAFHHLPCYLATLDLNTLSNLNIPFIFLELIGNKREFMFPKKTPKKISGKVPYRFVTNRVRVWRRPDSSWPARSPDLSPVEHVWDQLKRQMPSCHSVHDLELAVQDLWAHLPQDNIRCLINSMSDRVAACIAAGGGPTRY